MNALTLARLLLSFSAGLAIGIAGYTFVYARGSSYLTNDPAACANCHVMNDYYSAWLKGSHRAAAACNDCHTPPGFFGKYATKASNGFWHSFAFTTGRFPDPLRIKPHNRAITEEACRHCHGDIVVAMEGVNPGASGQQIACIRCHEAVGHW